MSYYNTKKTMEHIETTQEINLTDNSKSFLKETAKWSYFLSIMGFIGIGFMLIFSLFAGSIMALNPAFSSMSGISGGFISFIYIIMAAIYFFPVYYLFNFGKKLKIGLSNNDNSALEEGFKNLKSHYKFIGILTISILSLYALIFLGSIIVVIANL